MKTLDSTPTTRRGVLGLLAGLTAGHALHRPAKGSAQCRPDVPTVRATPEQSERLCGLAAKLASKATEQARVLEETDRLNDLYWETHGNTRPGYGCQKSDCPRCKDPALKQMWTAYSDMHDRGAVIGKARDGIYQEILSDVLAILEENGVEPPDDLGRTLAGEARVRAIVLAGDRSFLLIGTVEIEYSGDYRSGWPDRWGYPTLAIL